jgi:hypothetical protein
MATKKKAKRKTKTKRKKTLVSKARRTSVTKKRAKKTPFQRASTKKARPPIQPVAATPMPSVPAPSGERIGVVTHYYSHLSVATLRLSGTLRVGDVIHIRGHTTDFKQRVESLEVNQRR